MKIKQIATEWKRIEKKLEAMGMKMIKIKYPKAKSFSFNEIDYDIKKQIFEVCMEASFCGCCGGEHEYFNVPISWLKNKNWLDIYKKQEENKKQIRLKELKKIRLEELKRGEQYKKDLYTKLKKEYEGA